MDAQLIQTGGFPAGLITAPIMFIVAIVYGVFRAIAMFASTFFHPKIWNLPEGKGLLWKYIWWCGKVALYLVLFTMGGFVITIVGIIYVYRKLYKNFTTPPNKDEELAKEYKERYDKYDSDEKYNEDEFDRENDYNSNSN